MLSLAAVFKDVAPGYRIRLPTDKELAMPVSKDVKRLRDYESAILRSYQVCIPKPLSTVPVLRVASSRPSLDLDILSLTASKGNAHAKCYQSLGTV